MVNFKNNSEVKILSLPAYLALGHKGFNFLNKKKEKRKENWTEEKDNWNPIRRALCCFNQETERDNL